MRLPALFNRFFARSQSAAKKAPVAAVAHDQARLRARHRLIGAVILVGIGVLGFPLLFDKPARPLPTDLNIVFASSPAPGEHVVANAPTPVVRVDEPARAVQVDPVSPPSTLGTANGDRAVAVHESPPVTLSGVPAERANNQASSEAAAVAEAETKRYIVQIGAFTTADKVKEVRQKVEKLGFKTYTQIIESDTGKKTRVRIGPFPDKGAAQKAAAKLQQLGLTVAVLTL